MNKLVLNSISVIIYIFESIDCLFAIINMNCVTINTFNIKKNIWYCFMVH